MRTPGPLLDVSGLTVTYRTGRRPPLTALHDVSLTIAAGETVALVGESGSGKTTLGNAVLGLVRVASGAITFDGEDLLSATVRRRRVLTKDIQAVFQDPYGSLNPVRSIGQALAEPLRAHRLASGQDAAGKVAAALARVGLGPEAAAMYPAQFSGGQRQRIAIARALMTSPRLVICDEPLSALDLSVQAQVLNLLTQIQREQGVGYLFITHDLAVVPHIAGRVAVLHQGRVVECGPAAQVCHLPRHPYTRALAAAAPDPDPQRQRAKRAARPAPRPQPPATPATATAAPATAAPRHGELMKLAPQVQALLDSAPAEPLDFLTVAEQRQLMRYLSDANHLRFGRRPEPVAAVTDHRVAGGDGGITVRAYRPGANMSLPAHVVLHGGGWWLGSISERVNEAICRYRCVHAHCAVFAVEYRLAPEHPFPAAIDDIHSVLHWISAGATELGIDAGNISVGGTSAGANLAAAVALKAREEGPPLVFQLLEVPSLDLTGEVVRAAVATEEFRPMASFLAERDTAVGRYLRDPRDAVAPLASPLLAGDLSGLPPAHIMTAEFDPLREEGERYARRLREAGVAVTVTRHAGAVHGTSFLTRVWEPAQRWQQEAATALARAQRRAAAAPRLG